MTVAARAAAEKKALGVPLNDLAVSVRQRRMGIQHEQEFTYKGQALTQVCAPMGAAMPRSSAIRIMGAASP